MERIGFSDEKVKCDSMKVFVTFGVFEEAHVVVEDAVGTIASDFFDLRPHVNVTAVITGSQTLHGGEPLRGIRNGEFGAAALVSLFFGVAALSRAFLNKISRKFHSIPPK